MGEIKTEGISFDGKSIARRAGHGVLMQVLMRAKGIITLPFMTRMLGPEGMGVVTLISAAVSLLWPVLSLNLNTGCATYLVHVKEREEIRRQYYSCFNFALIVTVVGLLFISLFRGRLPKEVKDYYWLVGIFTVISVFKELLTVPLQVFQHTRTILYFNVAVEYSGALLMIILLYFFHAGPAEVILSWLFPIFIGCMVLFALLHRSFPYWPAISWGEVKKALAVSLPLLVVGSSQWIIQSVDAYFVRYFHSVSQVGIYNVAYSLASLTQAFLFGLNFIWYPTISRLWDNNREKFCSFVQKFFLLFVLLLNFNIFAYAIYSHFLIVKSGVFGGPSFSEAVKVVPLIGAAYAFVILSSMFQGMLLIRKDSVTVMVGYILGSVANIVLNVFLIPVWGIVGAGVATALSYGFTFAYILVKAVQSMRVSLPWRRVLINTGGVLLFITLTYLNDLDKQITWWNLIPSFLALTLFYLGFSYVTGTVTKREVRAIISHLKG